MNELPSCRTGWRSPLRIAAYPLGAVLSLLISLAPARAVDPAPPLDVRYDFDSDLVSVSAQSVPLQAVLGALAAYSGLDIRIDPSVSVNVLQHFTDVPLEQAILRLTGSYRALLVYDEHRSPRRLRKVHVMARPVKTPAVSDAPELTALNVYGMTWLAAHYDSAPRFLPVATIEAALSWQRYLARLSSAQRAVLHERMRQARDARIEAAQLASTSMPYRYTFP